MILRSYPFKRVVIVGTGLMGGSLGLAIKKNKLAKEIVGLSQRQSSLMEALKVKAIDVAETDIEKAIRPADLVVLATPVDSIVKLLPTIAKYVKRGAVVTDLGSTKVEIVDTAEKVLLESATFIGSHPLVGSEKKGIEHAWPEMYEGAKCIITPSQNSHKGLIKKIRVFWEKLGSHVEETTPQQHDESLAFVSHLPHVLAFSLMETMSEEHLKLTTQSLKDMTRIASSTPQLWKDICITNSRQVVKSLDQFIEQLARIRKLIVQKDEDHLVEYFTKAKEKRDQL